MTEKPVAPIVHAFIAVVAKHWPDMLAHAATLADGSFELSVPSPYRDDGLGLSVLADPDFDEIIISFGAGHSHGGPWDVPSAADFEFASTIAFVNAILDERVVACTFETSAWIGFLDDLRLRPDWHRVTRVRSWRGTHDHG